MFDTLPCEHAVSRNRTDRSSLLGLRSSCHRVVQFNSPAWTTTASVYVRESRIPSFTPLPASSGVGDANKPWNLWLRLVAAQISSCRPSDPHPISNVPHLLSAPPRTIARTGQNIPSPPKTPCMQPALAAPASSSADHPQAVSLVARSMPKHPRSA